jgi:hypothetical protein
MSLTLIFEKRPAAAASTPISIFAPKDSEFLSLGLVVLQQTQCVSIHLHQATLGDWQSLSMTTKKPGCEAGLFHFRVK